MGSDGYLLFDLFGLLGQRVYAWVGGMFIV